MDTQTSETSGNQVTMDDFKSLESNMSSQMSELREMIAQLMQAKNPSAPPLPDIPASLNLIFTNWRHRTRLHVNSKV
jgi:hypothetical protein